MSLISGLCENCGADVELIDFRSHNCREYIGYITGVDDGGPYEIMGDESEPDPTPLAAFQHMYGHWDEIDLTGARKPHIRIYRGDEYVYSWIPGADVLESMNGGENIPIDWRTA